MADLVSARTGAGGLGTPPARWSMLLLWVCGILQGFAYHTFAEAPLLWAVTWLAALVASTLLTTPGARPLSAAAATWVVGLGLGVAAVALWTAPAVETLWALTFAGYLVAFPLVRGNLLAGGIGSGLLIGAASVWAWRQGASMHEFGQLVGIPFGSVVAAVLWRMVLVRIVRLEQANRSAAALAAERADADREALAAAGAELAAIGALVEPLLTRIADGEPIDAAFRGQLMTAEATVRDRIRVPHLQDPALVAEVSRLREAGVTVLLLGEQTDPDRLIDDRLFEAVRALIAPVRSGRVVVRTLPENRSAAMSVMIQRETGTVQYRLGPDGRVLSQG